MTRAGVLVAIVAIAAACDSSTAPIESTVPIGDPSLPWQAVPFRMTDPVTTAAVAACRPPGLPQPVRVVLIDSRGGNRATILFESADRKAFAGCAAIRNSDGSWGSSSSSAGFGTEAPELPGVDTIEPPSLESEGSDPINGLAAPGRSTATGRAGANVTGVQLLVSGRPIVATIGNGWYSAWWPSSDSVTQVVVVGPDGKPLPQTGPLLSQPPPRLP